MRAAIRDLINKKTPLPRKRQQGQRRALIDGYLLCLTCTRSLPEDQFYMHSGKNGISHRSSYCDDCRRASMVARKIGVSIAEYQAIIKAAKGLCSICRNPSEHLYADHDHATGRLRGALCPACNSGLGSFRDKPDVLRAAARYLESFGV